jgi:transcriptional regulator with XRE-family HTH domain
VSENISTRRTRLIKKLANKAYRDAFVSGQIAAHIAAQIHETREARQLTQKQLADLADMAQARISLLESPDYENASLSTLKRVASAFDVALIVKFAPFSEFAEWVANATPDELVIPAFDQDCAELRTPVAPPPVQSRPETTGPIRVKLWHNVNQYIEPTSAPV